MRRAVGVAVVGVTAALAMAACAGSDVTAARLDNAIAPTFANLYSAPAGPHRKVLAVDASGLGQLPQERSGRPANGCRRRLDMPAIASSRNILDPVHI